MMNSTYSIPYTWVSKYIYVYAYVWGFPGASNSKESACNVGDQDLIPGLGRSPRKGNDYLFHGDHEELDTIE